MKRRTVTVFAVGAAAVGLTGLLSTTAWADTFTPAIDEPTLDLGFFDGPSLTDGATGGNHSRAEGRDGRVYDYGGYSPDDSYAGDDSFSRGSSGGSAAEGTDF